MHGREVQDNSRRLPALTANSQAARHACCAAPHWEAVNEEGAATGNLGIPRGRPVKTSFTKLRSLQASRRSASNYGAPRGLPPWNITDEVNHAAIKDVVFVSGGVSSTRPILSALSNLLACRWYLHDVRARSKYEVGSGAAVVY